MLAANSLTISPPSQKQFFLGAMPASDLSVFFFFLKKSLFYALELSSNLEETDLDYDLQSWSNSWRPTEEIRN